MKIHIQQGRLLDPKNQRDVITDLYLDNQRLVGVKTPPRAFVADKVIDAGGCWIMPGLIDTYAVLKNTQGQFNKTEAAIASKLGFTTLLCSPGGDVATDTPERVEKMLAKHTASVDILPIGALTEGLQGQILADLSALFEAGCPIFSNGKMPIHHLQKLLLFYEYAASFNLKIMIFPMTPDLSHGYIHEGPVSAKLGLQGISYLSETIALSQHLQCIENTGVHAHFAHISTAQGVSMIEEAKHRGLPISADCTMHHLHLTDIDVLSFNPHTHVLPPLRSLGDKEALQRGVKAGILDGIACSHHPLSSTAKLAPFEETTPGMSTLDTFLPLGIHLTQTGVLTPLELARSISTAPRAHLLGQTTQFELNSEPDFMIVDPNYFQTMRPDQWLSAGLNSPFFGWDLPGRVLYTFKGGTCVYDHAIEPEVCSV